MFRFPLPPFVWNIFKSRKIWSNVDWSSRKVPVNSCPIFMKLDFYRHIFEKYSYIKFHENPSSWGRVVPCGQTNMTKLIVAFRTFTNVPKIRAPTLSIRLEQRRKGHSQPSHETICVESDKSCRIKYRTCTLWYSTILKPTILLRDGQCYRNMFSCM